VCEFCGAVFEVRQSEAAARRYCSRECSGKTRRLVPA
jgi:hypothetical protein